MGHDLVLLPPEVDASRSYNHSDHNCCAIKCDSGQARAVICDTVNLHLSAFIPLLFLQYKREKENSVCPEWSHCLEPQALQKEHLISLTEIHR